VYRRRFRRVRAGARQEVKELVRGTRDALGTGFLGSLESFLAYLQTLMHFCERFARDEAATAAMLVRRPPPRRTAEADGLPVHWRAGWLVQGFGHALPSVWTGSVLWQGSLVVPVPLLCMLEPAEEQVAQGAAATERRQNPSLYAQVQRGETGTPDLALSSGAHDTVGRRRTLRPTSSWATWSTRAPWARASCWAARRGARRRGCRACWCAARLPGLPTRHKGGEGDGLEGRRPRTGGRKVRQCRRRSCCKEAA